MIIGTGSGQKGDRKALDQCARGKASQGGNRGHNTVPAMGQNVGIWHRWALHGALNQARATLVKPDRGHGICQENGTRTGTLYDGPDPIMDFNGSGSLEMRYLNGPTGGLVDTVIARESGGGTVAWYLPDRLGTIRDLINNSGSIIDHVDYSAFGTTLDQSDPSEGDRMMGFGGMELDSATGMNLAVYWVHDPGTGRWSSQDPLGFRGETGTCSDTLSTLRLAPFTPVDVGPSTCSLRLLPSPRVPRNSPAYRYSETAVWCTHGKSARQWLRLPSTLRNLSRKTPRNR